MFEGWVSDILATYLGHFLDVQKEHLRINVFRAFKAGFTLENVAIRPNALDHLDLPIKLQSGSIGNLHVQIPWTPGQKPIRVDLNNICLCFQLLNEDDLSPEKSSYRAWAAKNALIATYEMQALESLNYWITKEGIVSYTSDSSDKPKGIFGSLFQRLIALVLQKLEIRICNFQISFEDPWYGTKFSSMIDTIQTSNPEEATNAKKNESKFSHQDHIGKLIRLKDWICYWEPPAVSAPMEGDAFDVGQVQIIRNLTSPNAKFKFLEINSVLFNMKASLTHNTFKSLALDVVSEGSDIELSIKQSQLEDLARFQDHFDWLYTKSRYAHLRPSFFVDTKFDKSKKFCEKHTWRDMWRFAINAVILDIKGQNSTPWMTAQQISHARQRYALLYRKKLHLESENTRDVQKKLLKYGSTTKPSKPVPSIGGADKYIRQSSGSISSQKTKIENSLSPVGQQQLHALEMQLPLNDIISCRIAVRQSFENLPHTSDKGIDNFGFLRRNISWGITKPAAFLGVASEWNEDNISSLQPTSADIKEMLQAVENYVKEFDKDQQCDLDSAASMDSNEKKPKDVDGKHEDFAGPTPANSWMKLNIQWPRISIQLQSEVIANKNTMQISLETVEVELLKFPDNVTSIFFSLGDITAVSNIGTRPFSMLNVIKQEKFLSNDAKSEIGMDGFDAKERSIICLKFCSSPSENLEGRSQSTLDVIVEPVEVQFNDDLYRSALHFLSFIQLAESFSELRRRSFLALSEEARCLVAARKLKERLPLDWACKFVEIKITFWASPCLSCTIEDKSVSKVSICTILEEVYMSNIKSKNILDSFRQLDTELARYDQDSNINDMDNNSAPILTILKDTNAGFCVSNASAAQVKVEIVPERLESQLNSSHSAFSSSSQEESTGILFLNNASVLLKLNQITEINQDPSVQIFLELQSPQIFLPERVITALKNFEYNFDEQLAVSNDGSTMNMYGPNFEKFSGSASRCTNAHNDAIYLDIKFKDMEVIFHEFEFYETVNSSNVGTAKAIAKNGNMVMRKHADQTLLADVHLSSLNLYHLTPALFQNNSATISTLPLAEDIIFDKVHVVHRSCSGGINTDVCLQDIKLRGIDSGSFINNRNLKEENSICFWISSSLLNEQIDVGLRFDNVSIGHKVLIGLLDFLNTGAEDHVKDASLFSENCNESCKDDNDFIKEVDSLDKSTESTSFFMEIKNSNVIWKQQDAYFTEEILPAWCEDFLTAHTNILSLEVFSFRMKWPLISRDLHLWHAGCEKCKRTKDNINFMNGVSINELSLFMATPGLPGYVSLPIVQIPHVLVQQGSSADDIIVNIENLDLGIHPSQLELFLSLQTMWKIDTSNLYHSVPEGTRNAQKMISPSASPRLHSQLLSQDSVGTKMADLKPLQSKQVSNYIDSMINMQISLGCLSASILGSTASSNAIKLEWRKLSISSETSKSKEELVGAQMQIKVMWSDFIVYGMERRSDKAENMENREIQDSHRVLGVQPTSLNANHCADIVSEINHSIPDYGQSAASPMNKDQNLYIKDRMNSADTFNNPISSTGSVVSRYFTAAASDFDDLFSTSTTQGADTLSGKAIEENPKSLPIPLNINDDNYNLQVLMEVMSLAIDSRGEEIFNLNLQCASSVVELDFNMEALYLRAYFCGWHLLMDCMATYIAFYSKASTSNKYAHIWKSEIPKRTLLKSQSFLSNINACQHDLQHGISSDDAFDEERLDNQFQLQINLKEVELEIIGFQNASFEKESQEHGPLFVPLGKASINCQILINFVSNCWQLVRLQNTCLLVGIGITEVTTFEPRIPVLVWQPEYSFLGIKNLNIDISRNHGSCSTQNEEISVQSIHLCSLVERISVWTSSDKLCSIALLYRSIDHVLDRLLSALRMEDTSYNQHNSIEIRSGNFGSFLCFFDMKCKCIAFLFQGSVGTFSQHRSPLFEMAICDFHMRNGKNQHLNEIAGEISLRLHAVVFNTTKLAWEPFIDPWNFGIFFQLPTLYSGVQLPKQILKLDFRSDSLFEMSISQPFIRAANALLDSKFDIALAMTCSESKKQNLLEQLAGHGNVSIHNSTASVYRIQNLTGIPMEIWIERSNAKLKNKSPLVKLKSEIIEIDAMALIDDNEHISYSLFSGNPSPVLGVKINELVGCDHSKFSERKKRNYLYFRLDDVDRDIVGCINLERSQCLSHAMNSDQHVTGSSEDERLSIANQPHIVSVVDISADGTSCITFRSSLNVHNDSGCDLVLSFQTSLELNGNEEPENKLLLPKGTCKWLPVAYQNGLFLSLRPLEPFTECFDELCSKAELQGVMIDPLERSAENFYCWSQLISVQDLIESSTSMTATQEVKCRANKGSRQALSFSVGCISSGTANRLVIGAPISFHNVLPVAVDVRVLMSSSQIQSFHIEPNQRIFLVETNSSQPSSITLHVEGFEDTEPITPLPVSNAAVVRLKEKIGGQMDSIRFDFSSGLYSEEDKVWANECSVSCLKEIWPGQSKVDIAIQHAIQVTTRGHFFRIVCGLWVYNCIGIPISIQECPHYPTELDIDIISPDVEDIVPESWIAPLNLQHPRGKQLKKQKMSCDSDLSSLATSEVWQNVSHTFNPRNPPGSIINVASTVPPLLLKNLQMGENDAQSGVGQPLQCAGNSCEVLETSRSSVGGSILSLGRATSTIDVAGLVDILEGNDVRPHNANELDLLRDMAQEYPTNYGKFCTTRPFSRPRGMAEGMNNVPTFEMPSEHPSMLSPHGTVKPNKSGVRTISNGEMDILGPSTVHMNLQIRASQLKAPSGRTFWSENVDLARSGGTTILELPIPASSLGSVLPDSEASGVSVTSCRSSISRVVGAYPILVHSSPIPHGGGALQFHVSPRYVIHNSLKVPLLIRQQDAPNNSIAELKPGKALAARWFDINLPRRYSIRLQEAGWMWSGGFSPERSADLFVKIRHRDRGITMLIRIDATSSPTNDMLHISFSHNPEGFSPYRIENCSLETLHCRQENVQDQQDVLRPYCSLLYAWDEPTLPHILLLSLQGLQKLGKFHLDKVGKSKFLTLPKRRGEPGTTLAAFVRAEGPTRVLTIVDMSRHNLVSSLLCHSSINESHSKYSNSSGLTTSSWRPNNKVSSDSSKQRIESPSNIILDVGLKLKSVGVSLVDIKNEIAYARLMSLNANIEVGISSILLNVQAESIQVDNPSPYAAFPVNAVLPAPISYLGKAVAAAVEPSSPSAFTVELAIWRHHRSGVLCIDKLAISMPSIGIYLDHEHITNLISVVNSMGIHIKNRLKLNEAMRALTVDASSLDTCNSTRRKKTTDLPSFGQDLWELPPSHSTIYMNLLFLSDMNITLSFLPSPDPTYFESLASEKQAQRRQQRWLILEQLLSLAEIEDAHLVLSKLCMKYPLMDSSALINSIQRHYVRSLILEIFKIIGAASMFGDPAALLHHLGLGVWAFVSSPAAALMGDFNKWAPKSFLLGLVHGTQVLLQNLIFAISNATAKASSAARKGMLIWILDQYSYSSYNEFSHRHKGRIRNRNRFSTKIQTQESIIGASFRGIVGIVVEPIKGFESAGLKGLLYGAKLGLLGAVAIPLATLLEMVTHTADSVRHAVAGATSVGWLRPPRYVSLIEPLMPYDRAEAMGRWLLSEILREETEFKNYQDRLFGSHIDKSIKGQLHNPKNVKLPFGEESFLTSVQSLQTNCFLILTNYRVIFVSAKGNMWYPEVLWQSRIVDLESVSANMVDYEINDRKECSEIAVVRFVAYPAPGKLKITPFVLRQRQGYETVDFFKFLDIKCNDMEQAQRMIDATKFIMETQKYRVRLAGTGFVVQM